MSDTTIRLLLALVLAGMLYMIWQAWQMKQASPSWPYVMGEVESSRAYAPVEGPGQKGMPQQAWQTEVRYHYEVAGQRYTGNRLRALGVRHFSEAEAQAEIQPFPAGQSVRVYYDPAKPGSSVLIPG